MQLADKQRSLSSPNKRRLAIRHALATFAWSAYCSTAILAQQPYEAGVGTSRNDTRNSDIPASPWGNSNSVRQASNYFASQNNLDTRNTLKQPSAAYDRSNRIRLESASPYSAEASLRQRLPDATSYEPSVATVQFGNPLPLQTPNGPRGARSSVPVASEDIDGYEDGRSRPIYLAPRNSDSLPTAKPHTSIQNLPIEAQSGWQRVPASGLILESGDVPSGMLPAHTSTRSMASRGLPERRDPSAETNARTVSSERVDRDDHPENLGTIRLKPTPPRSRPSTELHSVPSIQLTSPAFPDGAAEDKSNDEPALDLKAPNVKSVPKKETLESIATPTQTSNPATNAALTSIPKPNEEHAERMRLAARLSHELLSSSPQASARPPEALEVPPGWQSVERELRQHLENCNALLRRNALHSAREEAIVGLRRLYRALDLHRKDRVSEPLLEQALTALREEADFQSIAASTPTIQPLVDSHTTVALKGRDLKNISPEVASQHYRAYARYCLVLASDGHQWSSDLLYALGKTFEKEADNDSVHGAMLRNQSVVCYQAAMQVSPQHYQAANQLGSVLTQLDRIEEAYAALKASIEIHPQANAWNNLAELYRRRGASDEANYAVQQATALQSISPGFTHENPEVTQIPANEFARYSPMQVVVPQSLSASGATPANGHPQNVSATTSPRSASSPFSKIFQK